MIAWQTLPVGTRRSSVGELETNGERLRLTAIPHEHTEQMWQLSVVNARVPLHDLSGLLGWLVFQGSEAQARAMLQALARGASGELAEHPVELAALPGGQEAT